MTTNDNKILPGLMSPGIEFFVHEDKVKAFSSGRTISFSEVSFTYMQILKEKIDSDNKVKEHLQAMHPNSEIKQIEQFVRCRFGGLDYQADMTTDEIQEGEYWDCPLRGMCKSEGVLCKAISFKESVLNNIDIKLMRLLTTNSTNEVIANELNMAMGTFHLAKKNLYKKLDVQTKQEVTLIAIKLNLI